MNRLIKQLTDMGKKDALKSLEALQSAAKELGYSEEDVAAAVAEFDNFPLSDDELLGVDGGYGVPPGPPKDKCTTPFKPVF